MIERYSRSEMKNIWSDQNRYETWLKVELAACQAMESENLVPHGITEQLRLKLKIDSKQILTIEERTKHDIIAFLAHLEEQVGESARWLHLGMTSSDILDTSFALQLQKAGKIITNGIEKCCKVLKNRAIEFKDLPMIGRTHGIHAEPTSVGLVFAGFYAEMSRNYDRFTRALKGLRVGKLAGAVGVYGNLSPKIELTVLTSLGLYPETCATQVVARDRHAEFFLSLALIAAAIERIALQVRHWQRTEVGEARESFGKGQKGSSAMPHKRNPILSENLCGLSRLVRSYTTGALENISLWHERDISHSSIERVIGPDATIIVDFMLYRVTSLIEGLVINKERVSQNLNNNKGLVFSEAVMLALVHKGLARQHAYELVQKQALSALENKHDFYNCLVTDIEIGNYLTKDELKNCFNLDYHLRYVEDIFNRVFMGYY